MILVPSAENSIPSVSGPAVISRTFFPLFRSTTATLAGVLSSSSSCSSSCFISPLAGGLPSDDGSVDTKAKSPLILTNSGLIPTSIFCATSFVSKLTSVRLAWSLLAATRNFPSSVSPSPLGRPPISSWSITS